MKKNILLILLILTTPSLAKPAKNIILILAGGRFEHGQHLAFDKETNTPLANVYTSVLQSMKLAEEPFGSGTGPLEGLKIKA